MCRIISESITFLEESVSGMASDLSKMISKNGAAIVRELVLLTTKHIFQLAFVLTPDGWANVRKEILLREVNHALDPANIPEATTGSVPGTPSDCRETPHISFFMSNSIPMLSAFQ
jgi:hypothetical protein